MIGQNPIQEKKRQKNLVIILLVLVLATFLIVYFGLLNPPSAAPSEGVYNVKKPEINFSLDILDDPILRALQPFVEIQPIDPLNATSVTEEIGRENPFLPF